MSDCCSSNSKSTHTKKPCPLCGIEAAEVSVRTIAHQVKHSWRWNDNGQKYFFCEEPCCDVVYFGEDNSVIPLSQDRVTVGVKAPSENVPLCYCFGASKADAISDPSIRDFVLTKTKQGLCSCETSNPSGRCCLKDFPRSTLD